MEKIIITGYPKSGNTWLSRLTANLVDCPVEGFLYNPNNVEIAIEGTERVSDYRVYKSHHQLSELTKEDIQNAKIIYVVRDPRDVSISGRNYFDFGKPLFGNVKWYDWSLKNFFPKLLSIIKTKINIIYLRKRERMNNAVLYGDNNVQHWCRISWKTHLKPYFDDENVLKVKYESLLSDPLTESKRILNFIGIEKDEAKINEDIYNQSFEKKKNKFKEEKQLGKANFMRKGENEQWKTLFSRKENFSFVKELKKELIDLGYDIEK